MSLTPPYTTMLKKKTAEGDFFCGNLHKDSFLEITSQHVRVRGEGRFVKVIDPGPHA